MIGISLNRSMGDLSAYDECFSLDRYPELFSPFERYYIVEYDEDLEDILVSLSVYFPCMAVVPTVYIPWVPGYGLGSHLIAPVSSGNYFLSKRFTGQMWMANRGNFRMYSATPGKEGEYSNQISDKFNTFLKNLALYSNEEYFSRICKGCANYLGNLGGECSLGMYDCATQYDFKEKVG